ncbi:MAG: hypothetical protein QME81_02195, partial [bacterium]|nr:hypothetical protein [bacterium]
MSEDEKTVCEERLGILASTSGIGYQVAANLRCESRLDEFALRDIVQGFLQAVAAHGELKSVYIEKCRQHTLQGGAVPKPWALYFGRVVTPKRFYQTMLQWGDFVSVTETEDYFYDLLSKPLNVVRRRLQNIPFLGLYNITPQHLRCPRECYDCG